jgi:uncharacterized membrane protein YeaQ/YmgE (transglycosylase-associated protein family)
MGRDRAVAVARIAATNLLSAADASARAMHSYAMHRHQPPGLAGWSTTRLPCGKARPEMAIMHLIAFLVFGMFVGLIARAIMPGTQSMGLLSTMLLGVVGSLFGGIVGNLLFAGNWNEPVAAGWIGSIVGSMLLLAVLGRTRRTRLL